MLELLLTIVHIVVCLFLVVVVLLQAGKGAEVGAVLGGAGSQAMFGGAGAGGFLSKLTVYAAIIFVVTSLGLTMLQGQDRLGSVMEGVAPPPAAVDEFPAAVTGSEAMQPLTDTMTDSEAMPPATEGAMQ